MAVVSKMPAVPPVLVWAIVASIFAAVALPCVAGRPPTSVDAEPKPIVENLPTTVEAQDFIRARCDRALRASSDYSRMCYELLLPYATSINGSYNRAATAGVTAMVSKLTFFTEKLADTTSPPLGECMQVVNEAISRAKDALAKLNRLDAKGDEKVDLDNPDLVDVANWVKGVDDNFAQKCRDCGSYASAIAVTQTYVTIANALVIGNRPYWSLPSPDGSGP